MIERYRFNQNSIETRRACFLFLNKTFLISQQSSSDLVSMVHVTIESSPPYYLGQLQVVHHRFLDIPSYCQSHCVLHLRSTGKWIAVNQVQRAGCWRFQITTNTEDIVLTHEKDKNIHWHISKRGTTFRDHNDEKNRGHRDETISFAFSHCNKFRQCTDFFSRLWRMFFPDYFFVFRNQATCIKLPWVSVTHLGATFPARLPPSWRTPPVRLHHDMTTQHINISV